MTTERPGNQKVPPLWWLASLMSAVLASALTAAIIIGVPRFGVVPVRERSTVTAPEKTQPGEVTLYELFGCSRQLGECDRYARILPVPGAGVVPNAFSTLTLCQEYSSKYVGKPPGKDGRWPGRPGTWLQCFARRAFVWYPANS
ncbi:MAG: hypothetical protein M0038_00850 [Pseudomonadota bacterium]|jgi:hypothetical protein|nr:hypothetical protein [Pseudomonadota bacterium]